MKKLKIQLKTMIRFLLGILISFLLASCSNDIKMDQDILAFHIYSQTPIDLDSENKENVALLSKSFGMEESEVKEIQKHILSKKSGSALRWSFRSALEDKVKELSEKKGKKAPEDFIVSVLAPYLNLLARNEIQEVFCKNSQSEKIYSGIATAQKWLLHHRE